jgi:hypothetical protein
VVFADALRDVPVQPETLLAIELQRHEFALDLDGITRTILVDPGATLTILRLAGIELSCRSGRYSRLEDCIAGVGVEAAFRSLERAAFVPVHDHGRLMRLWEHARAVAKHARVSAELDPTGITPEQAYLGGLLHILGALPGVLHWKQRDPKVPSALVALDLADRWNLPAYIKDLFCEAWMPGFDARWSEILNAAHRAAGSPAGHCDLSPMQHISAS